MNDSVAERVASRLKKAGCLAQFVDHDGAYTNQAELVAVGILSQAISTLTADNAAKDAAIAALRTELTALREATEVAKAIIRPFLNDIGGLKGKFHRGEESNERGEALLKVYDQLTADIATAALTPAAVDEPIVDQ